MPHGFKFPICLLASCVAGSKGWDVIYDLPEEYSSAQALISYMNIARGTTVSFV